MDFCKVLPHFYGTLRSVRRNILFHWSTPLQITSLFKIFMLQLKGLTMKSHRCCKGCEKTHKGLDTQGVGAGTYSRHLCILLLIIILLSREKLLNAQAYLKTFSVILLVCLKLVLTQNITLQIPDYQLQVEKKGKKNSQ